jgi:hypothetical protein
MALRRQAAIFCTPLTKGIQLQSAPRSAAEADHSFA